MTIVADGTFDCKWFADPGHYEENLLIDRKRDLYCDLRTDKKRRDLIVDLIALANSARRLGRPARLLLGIDNTGDLVGVVEHLNNYRNSDEPDHNAWEGFKHRIYEIVSEYVSPLPPTWELQHGVCQGHKVAYILIHPDAPPEAYHVARSFPPRSRNPMLRQGESWIRDGDSNLKIETRVLIDYLNSYSYAEVPYLLPSKWHKYLKGVVEDENVSRAMNLQGYQALSAVRGPAVAEIADEFLDDGDRQLLVLFGPAGSGKTTVLYRLLYDLASAGQHAMEERIAREEFLAPPGWIPVHLSLRGLDNNDSEGLVKRLLHQVNSKGHFWDMASTPSEIVQLLNLSDLKWIIFFDGFDEIWSEDGQRNFLSVLRAMLAEYPRLKIVISTRPEAVSTEWSGWSQMMEGEIAPLSNQQIVNYVNSNLPPDAIEDVLEAFDREPEMWQVCSYPVYLEAAMEEFAGGVPTSVEPLELPTSDKTSGSVGIALDSVPRTEGEEDDDALPGAISIADLVLDDPVSDEADLASAANSDVDVPDIRVRIPVVFDRIYPRLWERETRRCEVPKRKTDEYWDQAGKLALTTDGHRPVFNRNYAIRHLESEKPLHWLVNMAVLSRATQGRGYRFVAKLTQLYFAADFLAQHLSSGEIAEAVNLLRGCTDEFEDRLRPFLEDLASSEEIGVLFQTRSKQ